MVQKILGQNGTKSLEQMRGSRRLDVGVIVDLGPMERLTDAVDLIVMDATERRVTGCQRLTNTCPSLAIFLVDIPGKRH